MLENYVDLVEDFEILDIHPETVEHLMRDGKLTAAKFGYKQIQNGSGPSCSPTPIAAME